MTIQQEIALPNTGAVPSRINVHQMFDRISRRYDLLNRILSFGLDIYWRRVAVKMLGNQPNQVVLDLACGTGDLAFAAVKDNSLHRKVIGIDKSEKMLQLALGKTATKNANSVTFLRGDGMSIPIQDSTCDAAMIAFGIRNMPDTKGCLTEFHRLLKTNGKVVVLEFSLPRNPLFRSLHLFYLRHVVPLVGRIISGDNFAYSYLNRTVETYMQGEEFCEALRGCGFSQVAAKPLSFGIVSIYTGIKK